MNRFPQMDLLRVGTTRAPGKDPSLKDLNDAAHFIVAAGKEKFQGSCVVRNNRRTFNPARHSKCFSSTAGWKSRRSVRMAETIGNCLSAFNAREIRLAQTFERA